MAERATEVREEKRKEEKIETQTQGKKKKRTGPNPPPPKKKKGEKDHKTISENLKVQANIKGVGGKEKDE